MNLKLLGLIAVKEIQVDVVDTRYAIPCGSPIGIYLKSQGVMVVGTGRITRRRPGDRAGFRQIKIRGLH